MLGHEEDYTNKILSLGRMASDLLAILEPYVENKSLSLEKRDYNTINDAKTFLDYVIKGCESIDTPSNLFSYDESFPANPVSALELAIEIMIGKTTKITHDFEDVKRSSIGYKRILEKLSKMEKLDKEDIGTAKETILFFDGIDKKSDSIMYEQVFSHS